MTTIRSGFGRVAQGAGTRVVRTAVQAPLMNSMCEQSVSRGSLFRGTVRSAGVPPGGTRLSAHLSSAQSFDSSSGGLDGGSAMSRATAGTRRRLAREDESPDPVVRPRIAECSGLTSKTSPPFAAARRTHART